MLKATVLYAWRRGSFRVRVGVRVFLWVVYGQAWSHGSFRVQQLGLLPVIVIELGTAVYRIAHFCV